MIPNSKKSPQSLLFYSLLIITMILSHPGQSQNIESPLDQSSPSPFQQAFQEIQALQDGTTPQPLQPEGECVDICQGMQYYSCLICYKKCTMGNTTTLYMKTCEYRFCTWWETERYSQDNPTNTYARCTVWQTKLLPEQQCTHICCDQPEYQFFTPETMGQCVDVNRSINDQNNLVAVFVVAGIGGLFLIIILLIVFCWCRNRVIVCCKDFAYFFENIFAFCYERKKKNRDNAEVDVNSSKQNTRKERSKRKWQNIQRKKQVSELPTSKYIIQSQYEINPEIYCSICLDDGLNCQTSCGHSYHFQCLRESMTKRLKCPQCSGKKFNPMKITCQNCKDRQTSYSFNNKNVGDKYPDFYHEGKIYCDECLENHESIGRRQVVN